MIGYVILGTNDVSRARAFYDALLAEMGGEGFYAAYFRDLDGNKLDVFCYG
jgi:catechol 2,3-dioxygenase-like lactoylglutathione lyase family enzyme